LSDSLSVWRAFHTHFRHRQEEWMYRSEYFIWNDIQEKSGVQILSTTD